MFSRVKESSLLIFAQFLALAFPVATAMDNAAPDIVGSLIAITFLLRCILFKQWDFLQHDWVKIGIAFWLWQIASGLWAYDHSIGFTHGFIWGRFLLFGIAMAYWVLADDKIQEKLCYSVFLTIAYLSLDALYQYYSGVSFWGNPKFEGGRLTGPFDVPRVGAGILYLIFPLISYAIGEVEGLRKKIAALVFSVLGIMTIILSGDRSPTLLLLLGLGLLFLFMLKSKRIVPYSMLMGAVALVLALQLGVLDRFSTGQHYVKERQIGSTLEVITDFYNSPYGLLVRDTIPVIEKHWLLGVGQGNFRIYLCKMGNIHYFNEGCPLHPHNTYLDILASVGFIGLLLYLALIFALLRYCYQNFSVWKNDPLTIGLVVGFLVRIWPIIFMTAYTRSYNGFTFWLLIGWAISRIYEKSVK